MRFLVLPLALFPLSAWADIIPVSAPVTAAELYEEGATVTRTVPYTAPAGRHELLITGLPRHLDGDTLRAALTGAALGAVTVRFDRVLPADEVKSPALLTAEAERDRIEAEIRALHDTRADILMRAEAAQTRLAYLDRLAAPTEATSAETLAATLALIGRESLTARREAASAQRQARALDDQFETLQEALDAAEQTVAALTATAAEGTTVTIAIDVATDTTGTLTLTHTTDDAAWYPA